MNDTGIKNIGIIGARHIGSQIARLAVAKNYDVVSRLAAKGLGDFGRAKAFAGIEEAIAGLT
jgi:3-hydroxyacyl-CoA dehydrogenase